MADKKIGVLSCSGEECLGGTVSRLATRKMLEEIRPGQTVTICLPLYLAGGEEERFFAKAFPVIAVDGCSKCCAKRATEKYSGQVAGSVDLEQLFGKETVLNKTVSLRDLSDEHLKMVNETADEIRKIFDDIISK